jgi:hypothetical protein
LSSAAGCGRAREIIEPAHGVVALMKRYRAVGAGILLASIAMTVGEPARGATRGTYVIDERPALLSYDDLVELASPRPWGPDLEGRLETLLSTRSSTTRRSTGGRSRFGPWNPACRRSCGSFRGTSSKGSASI